MQSRQVRSVVPATRTLEGAGFLVHRPFPTPALDHLDPFLLFDEMGPMDLGPGEAEGAPDHPHRGFETVTYLLAGEMEHRDGRGNSGRLRPGDVQWMTAGSGLIHSEMPTQGFRSRGGRMHGFQLWVNLPRRDKMMEPRYQEITSERIPEVRGSGVTVRVIAGEALGVSAVIETRTPIVYLDLAFDPGAAFEQPVPSAYNAFSYVVEGEISGVGRAEMITWGSDGDHLRLSSSAGGRALLIAGMPLNEPIARYGPFVMNFPGEIRQAMVDYQEGKFGSIDPEPDR